MRAANATPDAMKLPLDKHLPVTSIPWRKAAIYAAVALGLVLLGAIPSAIREWNTAQQRDLARRELRLSKLNNLLSSAVIDAGRGEYEPARQTASDFFTALRSEVDKGADSDLNATQRERAGALLLQRDEIITLLARTDPAAGARLSDLYVDYRKALSNAPPAGQ